MFNKKQAVLKNESGELKAKWNSLKDEAVHCMMNSNF